MTKKDDDLIEKVKKAQEEAETSDQVEAEKLSEIDKIKQELSEMTEMAKRTMADIQNLRRRQEEEKGAWVKMANAGLISSLLPALDNLNRALDHLPAEHAEGITMAVKQCNKVFEDAGLTPIETTGKPFNPDLHEALIQGPGEKDIIIEELEKGYVIGERVIRHAKVKVGNGEKE